ncbi:MAG TPA: YceI family protein [Aggregatilineales bacterium]|nr:YceI family protein [Anaerolineales bacterium]HRE47292.1 YceI family protein [Aggregatilineales bacterium]
MATYTFESGHTRANFSVRHMMITNVRGQFEDVTGTLEFDAENPANSRVEAQIHANSINTGSDQRDGHLRSPDFFDVANYPVITFKSTRVEPTGKDSAKIHGELTIRAKTLPVVLDAEFLGETINPFGGDKRLGFTGKTKINREDYGLTWNVALETGGWLVGKEITIELDVEVMPITQEALATA